MNKIKILFTVLFLLVSVSAYGDTTLTSDCSASAVNTAIANEAAGGTVTIACSSPVTWNAQINLSGGKTLSGGGVKTGDSSTATGSWPITINITHGGSAVIYITNAASQNINRVTGFRFQGTGGPTWIISVVGVGTGTDGYGAFRIDNNNFNDPSYSSRVIRTDGTSGKMTGLVHKNVFYFPADGSHGYGNNSYSNASHSGSATCYGYDSWARPTGFGTDDFVFWEDNYMLNTAIETSEGGGRVVVRYNSQISTRTDMVGLDGHGSDTGGQHCIGVVAAEYYKNTVSSGFLQIVDMRGGKWMVFNNTTQSGYLQLNEYRFSNPGAIEWKVCSGNFCCPASPAQCDVQAPTYPTDFATCYPIPYQVKNTFVWNNLRSGTNMTPTYPTGGGDVSPWIVVNRDFWMPTYGTEANLPATCTAGANTFYGATDTGKLWNCDTTNHWTLTYTPYTYPHPLANEAAVDEYMIVIQKTGDGTGTVTEGDNMNCGTNCSHDYYAYSGQEVTFTATPATGMYFSGWTGGCVGAGLTCTTTISGDATITASFSNGRKCSLGTGAGTITVGP